MKITGIFAKASLTLLGACIMISSCVKEDMSKCPPKNNLRIHVTTNEQQGGSPDFDRNNIDSVTLFVFDKDGIFVTVWHGGPYTPGQDYSANLRLDPGEYRIVTVTNQGGIYKTNFTDEQLYAQRPTIDQIEMVLDLPPDGIIRDEIPDLHYGMLQNIVVDNSGTTEVTVVLTPMTYKVNFTVKGVANNGDTYSFDVADNNALRNLNNTSITMPGYAHYVTTGESAANNVTSSMIVLAMASDKDMPFILKDTNTGEVLYTGDLITMIKKAYQASGHTLDFDNTFEFDVVISFLANMRVSISVNGWIYNEQNQKL